MTFLKRISLICLGVLIGFQIGWHWRLAIGQRLFKDWITRSEPKGVIVDLTQSSLVQMILNASEPADKVVKEFISSLGRPEEALTDDYDDCA